MKLEKIPNSIMMKSTGETTCHAHLHEECLKHYRHKGDPRVTLGICGTVIVYSTVIVMVTIYFTYRASWSPNWAQAKPYLNFNWIQTLHSHHTKTKYFLYGMVFIVFWLGKITSTADIPKIMNVTSFVNFIILVPQLHDIAMHDINK